MANAFTNYNEYVYLNQVKLKGVTDISAQYNITTKPINIIGKGTINQVLADIPEANVSITRDLNFVDIFQYYTGINKAIRGSMHYGNRILGFDEGHLTSYGYSVDYGQTPVSNLGITVYGDMGSGDLNGANSITGLNASGRYSDATNTKIARPSDISISCYGSESNRIQSFSVDVSIPKIAKYAMNHKKPVQVSIGWPVVVDTTFVMEVDDYNSRRIFDYLTLSNFDPFSITVKGIVYDQNVLTTIGGDPLTLPDNSELTLVSDDVWVVSQLWKFGSSNTRLISTDFSASSQDVTRVSLTYKTYLSNNKLTPLGATGPSGPMGF
jgi:hypothetical protein